MTRKMQDLVAAGAFGVLGAVFLVAGRDLPLRARGIPGPGLFPLILAALTVALALLLIVVTVRRPPTTAVPATASTPDPSPAVPADLGPPTEFEDADASPSPLRPILVWLAVLGCAVLLPVLGFLGATVLLMAVVMLGVERRYDLASLISVVALPVACYELFAVLLDVRLPTGVFG